MPFGPNHKCVQGFCRAAQYVLSNICGKNMHGIWELSSKHVSKLDLFSNMFGCEVYYLSTYLPIYLPTYLPIYLSIYLAIYPNLI